MEDQKQDQHTQKLLDKLGEANAMASHAKTVAGSLKEASDHHGQQAHYHLQELAERVRSAGVGNDPEAEEQYCQRLMDRHRMHQTYSLAERDEGRFPDITPHQKHMEKSLHRLRPEAVHHDYVWGTVHEGGPAPEPDDYQPRRYDPQELLPREIEREKDPAKVAYFKDLFSKRDVEEIDPVVLIRTDKGREILDGHHRALGAKEADRMVRGVEMSEGTFDGLKGAGFSDMDIAYALLALGGCWDAADKVKGQFDGKPVRRTGFMAYEYLTKGPCYAESA
jgi:hypothetical protein